MKKRFITSGPGLKLFAKLISRRLMSSLVSKEFSVRVLVDG